MAVVASVALVAACGGGEGKEAATSSASSASSSVSSSSSSVKSSPSAVASTGCGASTLSKMTLRQKLAQMLVVGVKDASDARAVVDKYSVGGIFLGSWTDLSMLRNGQLKSITESSDVPLMVTVDQEGGRVSRLSKVGIDFPSARELAATKTPAQVQALARDAGRKMKALGITVDFAPDSDVSNQSADEVIGDRAFSNDPATVTKYAQAFAAGLKQAGVMPVFKHFPGHGSGSGDSHTGTVRTPPLSSLIKKDLIPYKTLVAPDVGVMLGHLIVPGLTGSETPASISPQAISLLRKGTQYGGKPFDGPIFTDDLSGMAAISDKYPVPEAVTKAVTAGADIALWISTDKVGAALDALESAVKSGKLQRSQVDDSVRRVLTSKGVLRC